MKPFLQKHVDQQKPTYDLSKASLHTKLVYPPKSSYFLPSQQSSVRHKMDNDWQSSFASFKTNNCRYGFGPGSRGRTTSG